MTSITWFFFVSFCRSTTRLFHWLTTPTTLKPFVPGVYQNPRHMFVSFYCFRLSLSLNRGQTLIKTVLIYNSMRRIIVRRCNFWKFLTEGVCTYNVIKYFCWRNVNVEINTGMPFYWCNFISNTTLVKYNIVQNFDLSA